MSFNDDVFIAKMRYAEDEWLNEFESTHAREIREMYERISNRYKREYDFLKSTRTDEELDLYDLFISILDSQIQKDSMNVDKLDSEKIDDFLYQFKMGSMS